VSVEVAKFGYVFVGKKLLFISKEYAEHFFIIFSYLFSAGPSRFRVNLIPRLLRVIKKYIHQISSPITEIATFTLSQRSSEEGYWKEFHN
jgi:hypothetical protein